MPNQHCTGQSDFSAGLERSQKWKAAWFGGLQSDVRGWQARACIQASPVTAYLFGQFLRMSLMELMWVPCSSLNSQCPARHLALSGISVNKCGVECLVTNYRSDPWKYSLGIEYLNLSEPPFILLHNYWVFFSFSCLPTVSSNKLAFSKATFTYEIDKINIFIGLLRTGSIITIQKNGKGRSRTTAVLECANRALDLQSGGQIL